MINYTDLIERLREQSDEIAIAGHAGWGNASRDAADAIEALVKEMAALKEQHHLRYRMWHDESIKRNDLQHELAALRAAIEAAEKVEPCGKIVKATGRLKDMHIITWEDWYRPECGDKLYTNPPSTEIEELRRDAARYRWLREESGKTPDFYSGEARWMVSREQAGMGNNYFGGKIDAAIDAAMQEKQP